MNYFLSGDNIIIDSLYFSAVQTLFCGQVFRFKPYKDGYLLVSDDKVCYLKQKGNIATLKCSDTDYFINYFDLNTDYASIVAALTAHGGIMQKAASYGKGIRILKQDIIETIFSFIISANNNIKRIQGIMDMLCQSLGDRLEYDGISYHAFPSVSKMAQADLGFYKEIGCGYRARYMLQTAKDIAAGFDVCRIKNMDAASAEKALTSLYGIGKKVADCILLFGYGRQDVFPVDTWIEKVYLEDFALPGQAKISRKDISDKFIEIFKEYSGYAQQYLFYYKREYDKIVVK